MAEAVANVARRVNETVEEGKDCLGKTELFLSIRISLVFSTFFCIFCMRIMVKYKDSEWHTIYVHIQESSRFVQFSISPVDGANGFDNNGFL